MTTLNKANFFLKVQEILEQYYLIPLNGSKKTNLKDGFIERPIHGATHASRAALWALVMHHYLQKISPDYVNESMAKIAGCLNIEIEELLLLILITMVCHDTARQGEGADLWEAQSAQIAHYVLLELGLEDKHAKLFSMAILFKDNPKEYSTFSNIPDIDSDVSKAFGYIRVLINLGDNLDLSRCVGHFKSKFIFKTLRFIDGFNEETHGEEVMDLLKEIHHVIYEQGDMIFSCSILDTKDKEITSHKARHLIKEKVNYEHAENVFAAIFQDVIKKPKLEPFLTGFNIPNAKKYEALPAFDPFIHGTNTSILSLLPKSNFEIMSPIEMMETYHAATMTGELVLGGYRCIQTKGLGKTSFAKLSARGSESYTLEKVLSDYTRLTVDLAANNREYFRKACEAGFKKSYLNINLILIYFVRARQSHESLDQIINKDELSSLFEKIEGSIQFYYFMQLLGTYIFPNVSELKKFHISYESKLYKPTLEERHISCAAENFFTYELIVQKIMDSKINIKEIINNPTQDNLVKILNIFELPKNCSLRDQYGDVIAKNIELPLTQFFSLKPESFEDVTEYQEKNVFSQMQALIDGSNGINRLLSAYLTAFATNELFIELGIAANQHLKDLNERLQLFKNLINVPQSHFKILPLQEYFLERKYPLVLLSESEELISLCDFRTEEYRSNSNLKIGTDIKILATDTNHHRLKILKYLELHKITNVQVILLNDLKQIRENHNRPNSLQHHNGGVLSLKWMAAKKVPTSLIQSINSNSSFFSDKLTPHSKLYSEKNILEVSNLLNDAKIYQDVQFEPCCAFRCASPVHHSAIELLVKEKIEPSVFQSLIGYSAKNNQILAKLIIYLTEFNLPQFYVQAIQNNNFRVILSLFYKAGINEGLTEELLMNEKIIDYIFSHQYILAMPHLKVIIAMHRSDKELLNQDVMNSIVSSSSKDIIHYFEKNNLQKYYGILYNIKELIYSLWSGIESENISNHTISLILDDKNMIQSIVKEYISLFDESGLNAGFIISDLGIELNFIMSYLLSKVIQKLSYQEFRDKAIYLKVIANEELINILSWPDINTALQIKTILKGYEYCISKAILRKIINCEHLCKMLVFSNNISEWELCSQFYSLLQKFKSQHVSYQTINLSAYNVAGALIKDIYTAINKYFSLTNNAPDKMHLFTCECNQAIELARSVLEVNGGVHGLVDNVLFGASYLNPINYFSSATAQQPVTYSFFKNEASVLLGEMKDALGKIDKESVDRKSYSAY